MFGSVFRMQAKSGKKEELKKFMMSDDRMPDGAIQFYGFDTGGDELWGVAVFQDEKSYRANADDPAQHEWYMKVREMLTADPEWHDGEIMASPMNR